MDKNKAKRLLNLAYAGLAVADTALAARREHSKLRSITKPLLIPTLLASGLVSSTGSEPAPIAKQVQTSTRAGLALSTLGDIALLKEGPRPFARGMAAFSLAQGAYIWAATRAATAKELTASPLNRALAGTYLVGAPGVGLAAAKVHPGLGLGVTGYASLLTSHAVAANQIDPAALSPQGRKLRLAGACLFVLSDSILGLRTFILNDPSPLLEGAVMASYTGAQYLIHQSTQVS